MDAATRSAASALLRLARRADTLALATRRARDLLAALAPVPIAGRRVLGHSDPAGAAFALGAAEAAFKQAAARLRDSRAALLPRADERPRPVGDTPGLYELRGRLTLEPELL